MKKSLKPLRRIGLIANPDKSHCQKALTGAARLLRRRGARLSFDTGAAFLIKPGPREPVLSLQELASQMDLLLVFGGDGTILRVAREAAGCPAPLLGINTGRLGFLSAITTPELPEAVDKLWSEHYTLETRPLIEATVPSASRNAALTALNEFVIGRGDVSRIIEVGVSVDDQELTRYRGDGLIVSSPTGSTAYSLAAGGAIVSPNADVFALTPICPHALSNRTVIVSLDSVVRVDILSTKLTTMLSADGQLREILEPGSFVEIRRSKDSVRLVRLEGSSFFKTLRQKLQWRGASV